jgi:hypothetical protein
MSFASTSEVLVSLATVLEALVPAYQLDPQDLFRVEINLDDPQQTGPAWRLVRLSAQGARRKTGSPRTCSDWETLIELVTRYVDAPTQMGDPTTFQHALEDSEQVCSAIYDWAATTDGILQVDPDLANLYRDGLGGIICTRSVRVEFDRQ